MKIVTPILLSLFTSTIFLGTGCSNPAGTMDRAEVRAGAVTSASPGLVSIARAAAINGDHQHALTALMLAVGDPAESPIEATEVWLSLAGNRTPLASGEAGVTELSELFSVGNCLMTRITGGDASDAESRTVAVMAIKEANARIKARADILAKIAILECRTLADKGDSWFVNDREKIHDALVVLAPFSIHSHLLSRQSAADLAKEKSYALSYVSESEHRSMLINAGHISRDG